MYFDIHATKYKGHMFWNSPPEIVTDDPNLAKEFGFSKHARYKKLYVKQVSRSEVDEIYYVTRKGTYRGHSVIVIGYVPEAKKYWMGPTFEEYRISSTEMNLVKEMGFKFYDQAFCDKDVPIDEVLDIVDEYDLRFKNGEYL